MLETLRIQNYALIDAVEVEFRPGFNVLSGETGAGKSIVAGALNLVLGARAAAEVVREGADRARIEASFRLDAPSRRLRQILSGHDIPIEDETLLLCRVIGADGRSKAYAGGSLVPVAVLAEIGDELVDLHGQHEHQSLLRAERQLDLLDAFGGTESAAAGVAVSVGALRVLDQQIHALESDDRDRERQLEFMRFELNELDAAELRPGELEEIRSRLALITNAEHIFTLASHAYALLYEGEEGPAMDSVNAALRDLEQLAAISGQFSPLAGQLAETRAQLEAVVEELRGYTNELEFDPEELDRLNARNALIGALKRKYGGTIEEMLAYRARIAEEIAQFENRDERLESLRRERQQRVEEAMASAKTLSESRRKAAQKLDQQVSRALQDLAMKGAHFETGITPVELNSHGIDRIEFLLAANAGERPKPLRQVASGGEISRIMLALKSVFAGADDIPTLIFDEIDAGVGGAVARNVADKFQQLALSHQVICITHLSQIAAVAGAHYNVSKRSAAGRTLTEVTPVEGEARVRELARLLDGSLSEVSLQHARTLLSEAAARCAEPMKGKRKAR